MSTTALATRNTDLAVAVDVEELKSLGRLLAASGYFERDVNPEKAVAQMCTKILAGRELGFGPFAAVNGIYIVKGKPSIGANLMASAVKASGRYDYKVRKMDASICEIEFFEIVGGKRESLGLSSFTADEGRKAGTQNMDKFPRNMLFARAMSNGVRWYCPDVFNGSAVYVPEEMGMEVDSEGEPVGTVSSTVTVVTPESETVKQNGNGAAKADADPLGAARKAFHAQGTELFGKEWDQARRWMLARYTTKATPDNVREHTGDMTLDELRKLRADMEQYRGGMLKQFAAFKAERAAELEGVSVQTADEMPVEPDAIPL